MFFLKLYMWLTRFPMVTHLPRIIKKLRKNYDKDIDQRKKINLKPKCFPCLSLHTTLELSVYRILQPLLDSCDLVSIKTFYQIYMYIYVYISIFHKYFLRECWMKKSSGSIFIYKP